MRACMAFRYSSSFSYGFHFALSFVSHSANVGMGERGRKGASHVEVCTAYMERAPLRVTNAKYNAHFTYGVKEQWLL